MELANAGTRLHPGGGSGVPARIIIWKMNNDNRRAPERSEGEPSPTRNFNNKKGTLPIKEKCLIKSEKIIYILIKTFSAA
jgi:hypothetical protein